MGGEVAAAEVGGTGGGRQGRGREVVVYTLDDSSEGGEVDPHTLEKESRQKLARRVPVRTTRHRSIHLQAIT